MADDFARELERQKLEAVKELAYGASHEINNPLANIAARAQTLLRDETSSERRRSLEAIHQQAMRAHEMISDLMLFARPPKVVAEEFDLRELAEQVASDMKEETEQRQMKLSLELADTPCLIHGDRQQLLVAVAALCRNSMEAIGTGGAIKVAVRTDDSQSHQVIEVSDDGPGISEEVRQHILEPFFSGREAGRGLGFGLSKCWRIVTEHGGQMVVDDSRARGACISLILPERPPGE